MDNTSILYSALSAISAECPFLTVSPSTGDKMGGIIAMLCISAAALIILIVLSLVIKHRKK